MKKIVSALILVFVMLSSATSAFAAPPQVIITSPSSGDENQPDYFVNQPLIQWTQHDPDPGQYFKEYYLYIFDPTDWSIVWFSGIITQNSTSNNVSYSVPIDLPKGKTLAVMVNVSDNTSEWSHTNIKYMHLQP